MKPEKTKKEETDHILIIERLTFFIILRTDMVVVLYGVIMNRFIGLLLLFAIFSSKVYGNEVERIFNGAKNGTVSEVFELIKVSKGVYFDISDDDIQDGYSSDDSDSEYESFSPLSFEYALDSFFDTTLEIFGILKFKTAHGDTTIHIKEDRVFLNSKVINLKFHARVAEKNEKKFVVIKSTSSDPFYAYFYL